MSITDELREWFKDRMFMANGWQEIHDIADRIDAEHESAMYDMRREHDEWVADRDANWVKLPVGADGEPWRLGDELMMEGEVCEVVGIGGHTIFYAFGDGVEWTIAHNNRHHHAPTVEDVLREFAAGICGQNADFAELAISEYAKRLQLREVDG